jgi:hypothetical protein
VDRALCAVWPLVQKASLEGTNPARARWLRSRRSLALMPCLRLAITVIKRFGSIVIYKVPGRKQRSVGIAHPPGLRHR